MTRSDPETHSFIVKLWLEQSGKGAGKATCRGHITHVPGGERRYLKDLDEIKAFIAPYVERMGVKLGVCWRMRRWLKL